MAVWEKWHWDGLGWAVFGPLGNVLARAMGDDSAGDRDVQLDEDAFYPQTRAGDFGLSLMALLPPVIHADQQVSQPEIDFVHYFFMTTFGNEQAQDLMSLLEKFLELDYSQKKVCQQVEKLMDFPSKLEIIHLLFGLAKADAHLDQVEIDAIQEISTSIGLTQEDFNSIRAMFVDEPNAPYTVLAIDPEADRQAVERAYREMGAKYDPGQVSNLGEEFQKLAGEKFEALEAAYQRITQERGWT
ncbi:MAG: TerB family tellurite resistance protein [Fidelibacterota bacterium]|nr:MAG: TerB family tellurite resistance protein [Candidatus Neomarinimicrobiota bacterium]